MQNNARRCFLSVLKKIGLSGRQAHDVIEAFFTTTREALRQGREVEWLRFGSFRFVRRKPRRARNPRTGELLQLPERNFLIFRPSQHLKKKLNYYLKEQNCTRERADERGW